MATKKDIERAREHFAKKNPNWSMERLTTSKDLGSSLYLKAKKRKMIRI